MLRLSPGGRLSHHNKSRSGTSLEESRPLFVVLEKWRPQSHRSFSRMSEEELQTELDVSGFRSTKNPHEVRSPDRTVRSTQIGMV